MLCLHINKAIEEYTIEDNISAYLALTPCESNYEVETAVFGFWITHIYSRNADGALTEQPIQF